MVYVDNFNIPYRRMKMSHMVADTPEELRAMAIKIGISLKWIQYPNTADEHFDICLSKKQEAVRNGAIEVNMRTLASAVKVRRETGVLGKMNK